MSKYDDYMNTEETAKFIGVTKQAVEYWRKKGWLMPDVIGHGKNGRGGVYYYSKERILQLASVYAKKNYKRTANTSTNATCAKELQIVDEKQSTFPKRRNFSICFTVKLQLHISLTFGQNKAVFFPLTLPTLLSTRLWLEKLSNFPTRALTFGTQSIPSVSNPQIPNAVMNFPFLIKPLLSLTLIFAPTLTRATPQNSLPTYDNREQLKHRNNLLLDITRLRANGKKIDGVGNLPRIMRTPGTFNYKLGTNNAPICHIVEDSGLRFAPNELDEQLNALIPVQTPKTQATTTSSTNSVPKFNKNFIDDRDFNIFRTRRMLDFISPSSLTYDEWLAVGMALKNTGCDCSDWEQWSRSDERFKDGECESKWNCFNRDGYDIGTLYHFAQLNGYDAQNIYREWKTLQNASQGATIDSVRIPSSHGRHFEPRKEFLHMNDTKKSADKQDGKAQNPFPGGEGNKF